MLNKLTFVALLAGAYGFGTMMEEDSGLCIVKKGKLSKKQWAVGLGDCADGVEFEFNAQGGLLKTAGGLCLASQGDLHRYTH
jgi:hypothetical protein